MDTYGTCVRTLTLYGSLVEPEPLVEPCQFVIVSQSDVSLCPPACRPTLQQYWRTIVKSTPGVGG
jgi:hypothetical protein